MGIVVATARPSPFQGSAPRACPLIQVSVSLGYCLRPFQGRSSPRAYLHLSTLTMFE
jgi:hypothetical protein